MVTTAQLPFSSKYVHFGTVIEGDNTNLLVFEPKYEDTNVYFWIYDFNSEKFQSAGEFNVKGLPDLYYLATMKDKVAILTNIDDDMTLATFKVKNSKLEMVDEVPIIYFDGMLNSMAITEHFDIIIGSDQGLYKVDFDIGNCTSLIKDVNVTNVKTFETQNGYRAVFTSDYGFNISSEFHKINEDKLDWSWNWFGGITDGVVTDFDLSSDGKLLLSDTGGLQIRDPDGAMWRLGGVEAGLPFSNLTSVYIENPGQKTGYDNILQMELSYKKSKYWIGAKDGLVVYDDLNENFDYDNKWRVFQGYRWLAGEEVLTVYPGISGPKATIDRPSVFVVTDVGITHIRAELMGLKDKAMEIAKVYDSGRHGRKDRGLDHPMNGLVSHIALDEFGDLSKYSQGTDDNEGLWTAMFAAGEAFRYAETGNKTVMKNVAKLYDGCELLLNLTSVPGLLSRSVATSQITEDRWVLYNQTNEIPCDQCEGLYWKNDISQDSIIGHMFFLPIFAELGTDIPWLKKQAVQNFLDIVNRIVENGYQMIDWNGKRTTWGFWNPEEINHNPDHYSERSLNSLQIITYLAAAEALSVKYKIPKAHEYIKDHLMKLFYEPHRYQENILNVKMTNPEDDNYSDDEQAFLTYYLFYFTTQHISHTKLPHGVKETIDRSMYRHWKYTSRSKASLWGVIFNAFYNDSLNDEVITDKIYTQDLERMPISQIDWPTSAYNRKDVSFSPYIDRTDKYGERLTEPLWKDESNYLQWNGDPFMAGCGAKNFESPCGSGKREFPGTVFTLPYWMARYHDLISEE